MDLFLLLVTAHLVSDYPLQTDWVYLRKIKSFLGGLWHAGITLLVHLFFLLPYIADPRVVTALVISVVIHQCQDYTKILTCERPRICIISCYLLDQLLHVAMAGLLAYLFINTFNPTPVANPALIFFWHEPIWAGLIAAIAFASFALEVTLFVIRRAKDPTLLLRRNYTNMLIRGVIASIIYALMVF